jgi:signal transduction histidine kinase
VVNLLQNALQASPREGEVRLSAQWSEQTIHIVVEDGGEGIPREHLEKMLVPFFTTKPQGTGLGLAITCRIVQEHGGDIQLESSPGNGTRIAMIFPTSQDVEVRDFGSAPLQGH